MKQKKQENLRSLIDSYRKPDKVTQLKKDNKQLIEEVEAAKRKIDVLRDTDREYKPTPIIANNKLHSEATAFMIASDWHIEEEVDPKTVNNKNVYNLKIAMSSGKNFFVNGVKLLNICRKDITIKNIVLGLLGDFISGYIHDELIEINQLSPIHALLKARSLIASGISYLLKETDCKIIAVCKNGNHGRTTKKQRHATDSKNSYEWLLYQILADDFRNEKRIKFVIEDSYHTYLSVYNYLIRLHHGHYLRFQGGVGGITIPANKAIAQWNKQEKADLDVLGNWHQLQLDTGSYRYVMNGSNIGYNAYAISIKASYEPPAQAFFLIDKKRFKTISAPIFVR